MIVMAAAQVEIEPKAAETTTSRTTGGGVGSRNIRIDQNRVQLPNLRAHPQHRQNLGRSLGLLLTFAVAACGIAASGPHGPMFVHEPLDLVEFSNTTGARVECKAHGKPEPTVSWLLSDGSPISNVPGLRHSMPDGTLVFPPFRAEDYRQDVHAVVYRCAASNTVGTLVSRDVKVKAVVVQPYEVYVYDVYVIRGNSAVMKCHVPNFLQDYVSVTSWVKDGAFAIPTAKIEENGKYVILDGGNLIVNHVGNEDAGNAFWCQTKHRLTGELRTSLMAGKLYVTDPQGSVPPRISASEITVTNREGRTAVIACVTQGHPSPTTVWFIQIGHGNLHPLPNNRRFLVKNSALIIKSLRTEDTGVYVCEASNSMGTERAYTRLVVLTSLSVKIQPPFITADIGNSVTFHCQASGLPAPTITWLKDGTLLPAEDVHFQDAHALTIKSVTSSHRGLYQCLAKNDFTSAQGVAELKLGDTPPELLSVFEEQILHPGSSLTLRCVATGTPTPQLTWALDDIPVTSVRTQNEGDERVVGWLNVTKVRTDDSGVYSCTAANKAGRIRHAARINIHGPLSTRVRPAFKAVADQSAVLHCPIIGYPWDTITWEKEEFQLPVNHRQNVFKNGTLVVENVRRSADGGKYICTAVNKKTNHNVKAEIEVTVMVPPKIIPFSFEDVREGARARLQCVISEGDLPLTLSWRKDNLPIPVNSGILVTEFDAFSSVLSIPTLTSQHNGNYSCLASNAAGTATHHSKLFINVAPKISPFSFQEDLFEGALARISCVVYQGDLPVTLSWLKDGHEITSNLGIITHTFDEYSSILTIERIEPNKNGNYTCVARNSAATSTYSTNLNVKEPPKIIPFTFQDGHLLEDMLVRVTCVVSRGDPPLNITWLKDGSPIPSQLAITIRDFDQQSSILSIDPLTVQHNGNYSCVVQNPAAITVYTAKLIVNVPPRWKIEPHDMTVAKGDAVTIPCDADGFPKPTTRWMKVQGNEPTGTKVVVVPSLSVFLLTNGSLRIAHASDEHRGYYFCIASNGVGHDLGKVMHLAIMAPPTVIHKQSQKTAIKGEDVILECDITGNFPIKVSWKLENTVIEPIINNRYRIKQYEDAEKNVVKSELIVTSVEKTDSTTYSCNAGNTFGKDEAEIRLIVMEPPEFPKNVQVTRIGNRTVQVRWTAPFDGNSAITQYIVQYKKEGAKWEGQTFEVSVHGTETVATVERLSPATTYNFRIRAENDIGVGEPSEVASYTTDEEAPDGPPLNVEVEPTDATSLRVSWKPPDTFHRNGGIRGYNIGHRIHGSSEPYTFNTLEVPEDYTEELIYQLNNLNMYTQYSVVVQAYNKGGAGPLSPEVIVLTSEDVPSQAPVDVKCSSLSSRVIYVTWSPPPSESVNGILRGYKVLFKPTSIISDILVQSKVSQVPKINLVELEVSTNYSIQILAFTKMGDGIRSNPVFCKTHEDVPGAPDDIKVLATSADSVIVSWKPPSRRNGVVHKYNVYVRPSEDDGEEIQYSKDFAHNVDPYDDIRTSEANSLYYEINGLKKNHRYDFWVTALSSVGEGPTSKIITEIPTGPILGARAASFDDVIRTPWKKDVVMPCKAVGTPVPKKKWLVGGSSVKENDRVNIRLDGSLQITRIERDDTGNYTCTVVNEHGRDQVHYCIIVQVPPNAPSLEIISKSLTSIQLQWLPGESGGDDVKGYVLFYKRDRAQEWQKKELPGNLAAYTLDRLACGATYQLYMEAFNNIGHGPPCDVLTIATKEEEMKIPQKSDLVREGSTFATIHLDSWPSTGCPVHHFTVEYKKRSSKQWTTVGKFVKPSQKKLVIPGLTAGTWFTLRLTVHTSSGPSTTEYEFSTHTSSGGTLPPEVIMKEDDNLIMFHLDPLVLVPIAAIFMVVLISIFVVCACRNKRKRSPTKHPKNVKEWMKAATPRPQRNHRAPINSYVHAKQRGERVTGSYPSLQGGRLEDPVPYATSQVTGTESVLDSASSCTGTMSTDAYWKDKKTGLELPVRPNSDGFGHGAVAAQMWLASQTNAMARRSMYPGMPSDSGGHSAPGSFSGSTTSLPQETGFTTGPPSHPHLGSFKDPGLAKRLNPVK